MPNIDQRGNPVAPLRMLSVTEVFERLQAIINSFTGESPAAIGEDSPLAGRAGLPVRSFIRAVNTHFFPRPLRGLQGLTPTLGEYARILDDFRDMQLAQLRVRGVGAPRALSVRAMAAAPAAGAGIADGYPPAPLAVLSLSQTKTRIKNIMGAQLGVSSGSIADSSPVIRPGILWTRLLAALNTHFFPGDLHGIVGFLPGELVGDLGDRIKWTRDPQM